MGRGRNKEGGRSPNVATLERIRSSKPAGRGNVRGLVLKLQLYHRDMSSLKMNLIWGNIGEAFKRLWES